MEAIWYCRHCQTAGLIDNRAKLPPVTLDFTVHRRYIIDNGGKFTAGVVGHRWKIYHLCHRDQCKSGERCRPPLSTMPVVNLSPVSFSSVVHLELRISSRKFEKNRKGAKVKGKRYDFLTEKYRNQTQMLPQPRFMLLRAVSSAALIRYPSTFKHSPSKLPTSILSYPSLFLATRLPFGIPICYLLKYIFFLNCPSPFWATHRPSKLPITTYWSKHNSKCQIKHKPFTPFLFRKLVSKILHL